MEIMAVGVRSHEESLVLVDDVIWNKYVEIGLRAGRIPIPYINRKGYADCCFPKLMDGKTNSRFHHAVWKIHCMLTGKEYPKEWNNDCQINHINENKLDNRIENLEIVSGQENIDKSSKQKDMFFENSHAHGGSVVFSSYFDKKYGCQRSYYRATVIHFKNKYQKKFGINREADARQWADEMTKRLNANQPVDDLIKPTSREQIIENIKKTRMLKA